MHLVVMYISTEPKVKLMLSSKDLGDGKLQGEKRRGQWRHDDTRRSATRGRAKTKRLRGATATRLTRELTPKTRSTKWVARSIRTTPNQPNPRQTNHDGKRNHAVVSKEGRGWNCLKGKNELMIFSRLVLHLFSLATSTTQARQRRYSSSICPIGVPR